MKIRKPFVMGGMLLVAALLFLFLFLDISDPPEVGRQTISFCGAAEGLSLDEMSNTSDKRRMTTHAV